MFFKANSNNFHHLPNKLASLHSYITNFFQWQSKTRLKMYWPKREKHGEWGQESRTGKSNQIIKLKCHFCGKSLLLKLEFSNPLPHGWDTPTPVVLQAPWPRVLPKLTKVVVPALLLIGESLAITHTFKTCQVCT